jgi:hypothetical protein
MRQLKPTWLILLILGACATDREFGSTVNHNVVAQAVDMTPQYAGVPIEGGNGQRSADAYKRYLKGNVKALAKVTGSTAVGGQGGAADSGTPQ